jgi:ligand-binding sensor domain-containing protein
MLGRGIRRKPLWIAAAVLTAAGVILGGWGLRRVTTALGEARSLVESQDELAFTARALTPVLPAGLESIGAPADFVDAQVFDGRLFVAGSAGLFEYDTEWRPVARYRVGAELPPAPLTALGVGFAGDSRARELWMATAGEGLIAFDGRGFRQVYARDARLRKLTAVLTTETGRVLIGTEKAGVLVYDGSSLRPFHASLGDVHVTALAGTDTDLWVGTLGRGLLHWRAGAMESLEDALPDRQVLALASEGERVYAGTALGIAEIRGGKIARVLAPGYFAQSLLAAQGKLWMGTLEEGMFEVPLEARPGRSAQPAVAAGCQDCSVRRILRIEGQTYALAEDSLRHDGRPLLSREEAPLKDRNISALGADSGGRLWIGYFDRGLQILDPRGTGATSFEDDRLFCINRIVHDLDRGLSAVATANGLVMFDASTARRRAITQSDGLIANQVTDVLFRPDGSLVAATPAGVSFVDASGISSIYAFQGLVNNHVYALGWDGSRVFAGTLGGLSILENGLVKASYTTANSGLRHNWITALAHAGNEWFAGTYGAGVIRLDALGRWQAFDDLRGTLEINPNAMAVSPVAVYAGTLDRGLAVYHQGSGRWNFFAAGLPSLNVTAVEARGGLLYIGTDNGLVKVPETTVAGR